MYRVRVYDRVVHVGPAIVVTECYTAVAREHFRRRQREARKSTRAPRPAHTTSVGRSRSDLEATTRVGGPTPPPPPSRRAGF